MIQQASRSKDGSPVSFSFLVCMIRKSRENEPLIYIRGSCVRGSFQLGLLLWRGKCYNFWYAL